MPRPRLIEALHTAVLSHRLALLAAPAGSGKTTTAAALHYRYPNLAFGWVTLDEEDNDPAAFLAVFIAALQRCLPECGKGVAALLGEQSTVQISPRRMMAMLINDILAAGPEPLVLVLDDLHCVTEAAVLTSLDSLLANLPPILHLVATTRTDPSLALVRLRARGQLAEFRLPVLQAAYQRGIHAEVGGRLLSQLNPDRPPERRLPPLRVVRKMVVNVWRFRPFMNRIRVGRGVHLLRILIRRRRLRCCQVCCRFG
ncbi:MAG: AAA family ATPase [Candidatus Promineifilaceae bacterium]